MKCTCLAALCLAIFGLPHAAAATPLGSCFSYQGRLSDNDLAANGNFDLRFILYNSEVGDGQLGPILTNLFTEVRAGLFSVELDFGSGTFDGTERWLEVSVRPTGSEVFTTLTPRQTVGSVPYALYALTPAGPKGDIGPQGIKGDKGDTGAAGKDGATGATGARGLTWRGAWSAITSYVTDDVVQYGGSAWMAKRSTTTPPSEGLYWSLLAQKGDKGETGPAGPTSTLQNVGIGTMNPRAKLDVVGGVVLDSSTGPADYVRIVTSGNTAGKGGLRFDQGAVNYFTIWSDSTSQEGLALLRIGFGTSSKKAADNPIVTIGGYSGGMQVKGNVSADGVQLTSDRNAKENIIPVDPNQVLDKVVALPVSEWNFKGEDKASHVGPMAQDFRATFGLGADDKHISMVDANGVALAAIQGLNQKVLSQREEAIGRISALEKENAELRARLSALEILAAGLAIKP